MAQRTRGSYPFAKRGRLTGVPSGSSTLVPAWIVNKDDSGALAVVFLGGKGGAREYMGKNIQPDPI